MTEKHLKRIVVLHESYGCDTGCCGHVVEVDGERVGGFEFAHPNLYGAAGIVRDQRIKEYVRDLVTKECGQEHVEDIDWDNCVVLDD